MGDGLSETKGRLQAQKLVFTGIQKFCGTIEEAGLTTDKLDQTCRTNDINLQNTESQIQTIAGLEESVKNGGTETQQLEDAATKARNDYLRLQRITRW